MAMTKLNLIPEEHPICGELMREYLTCNKTTSFFDKMMNGPCDLLSARLSKCLNREKFELREPKVQRARELYREKAAENEARMQELKRKREEAKLAAEASGSSAAVDT